MTLEAGVGMSPNRVLVFGHSHLGALSLAYKQAATSRDLPYELTIYQFLRSDRPQIVNPDNKGWRYHPEILGELLALIETYEPTAVVMMMQGEQAISSGLVMPVRPYDFFFPREVGYIPEPGSEMIPFNLILQTYVARYQLIADFLTLISSRLPPLSFALSPPPPVGDSQFILDSDIKHGNITRHIEKFGLPSATWRWRIWKLNTIALSTIYASKGIAFINPPHSSSDDDGCLRKEFRTDLFHANAAYGQLLLDQIGLLLSEKTRAPEHREL